MRAMDARIHNEYRKSQNLRIFMVFIFLIGLAAAILGTGCKGTGILRESGYVPGLYEGIGQGYRGPILVEVQLSPAGIEDITITGHEESIYPGLAAMEELLDAILETGSTDVDAVSGATFSSRGFLDAVEDALDKAAGTGHFPCE